ncbi:MAG: radical SAM protein [Phycisphaerales bacterium]|nr:MAG: radical SAM protein [Phycisphaerales bacterium]
MELPRRNRGDELLKPGELLSLRRRLRSIASRHDLATVIACAFDHRTRMLPFIYADTRMAPAGVRAIGSAMFDVGFQKTRIVLQQWNRNFRPSQTRLDGRIPDIFMVSSMQIHSAECRALIRDACRIDPVHRPLIIAGGPRTIYEPWDVFSDDPNDPWGADAAVTGEEYVLLSLLEVLLSIRANDESLRTTFMRVRNSGILDEIPGLVYARTDREGVAEELVDTGIQRLLGDLDELPHPVLGYQLLEPPSRKVMLGSQPLPASRIRRYSPIASLVLTLGCKFACPYCPIPAYNQRQYRVKSGQRIADEMTRLYKEYGVRGFFGADDNFFNDRERTLDILETLARQRVDGSDLRHKFRWGTEVTVHDILQMKEHLRKARQAGIRALWIGVEDMTATLIRKGQSVDKTSEAFRRLQECGICPMPMMMHHDTQPLYTFGKPYGLINQVRLLRKVGATSLQVLMITPATGSKLYEETFTSGMTYESAGGRRVEPYMFDANYVVASKHAKPGRKQLNIMAAYLYFYNPLRFLIALVRPKSKLYLADAGMQLIGMWGLTQTIRRTFGWALRLMSGDIQRKTEVPASRIPMRGVDGTTASHALPGTPQAELVQMNVKSPGESHKHSEESGVDAWPAQK